MCLPYPVTRPDTAAVSHLSRSRKHSHPEGPGQQRSFDDTREARCSAGEDLGLLRLEFRLREDAGGFQLTKLLELSELVVRARTAPLRWRRRRLRLLSGVDPLRTDVPLLRVLLRPAICLAP